MLAAALLAGEGKKQIEIADTLGLSQAAISRLLAEAHKEYLQEELRFLSDKIPQELMGRVLQRIASKELTRDLELVAQHHGQRRGPLLRVFSCGPQTDAETRIHELSRQAAPYVKALILRSHVCGVTWGGMLKGVVSSLRAIRVPAPWCEHTIDCVPLSGEPLGNDPVSFSSSSLARELGNIVNGEQYNAPSLAMVPAFIPEGFSKQETDGVWKLIELVRSYDSIFSRNVSRKTEPPVADCLEMILTSVSPADRPLGFGKGRLFETGSVTIEELQRLVIGDMGGVCFPRPSLNRTATQKLESVNRRWTGLRIEHLIACANRSQNPFKGPPGVVVISGGKARASFIYELVKRGLINHLIIDDVLAQELEKISDPSHVDTQTSR